MIRIVLDTNIIVSSVLTKGGGPKAIFDLTANHQVAWFVSEPILAEYGKVLAYPRLRIAPADIRRTMQATKKYAQLVAPNFTLQAATDESDNRFLECAQVAKAHFLVTGNLRHYPAIWKYTKVVSPSEFLLHWQMQQPLSF